MYLCRRQPSRLPNFSHLDVGCYVDDFVYYSTCYAVEQWFETGLAERLKVDFMGTVSWFLRIFFEWTVTPSCISAHLSQEGFMNELLDRHHLLDCNTSLSPYRSGFVVDRIPPDSKPPTAEFVTHSISLWSWRTHIVAHFRPSRYWWRPQASPLYPPPISQLRSHGSSETRPSLFKRLGHPWHPIHIPRLSRRTHRVLLRLSDHLHHQGHRLLR